MGAYINQKDKTSRDKIEWCLKNGRITYPECEWNEINHEKEMYVCAVYNVSFIAFGIAFNENEFNLFKIDDGRLRVWFVAPIDKLREVSNLDEYLKRE